MEELKSRGVVMLGLEQSDRSIDYRSFAPEAGKEYCLVLGNEIDGVDASVLSLCDATLEIPMYGRKKSLNVTIAGSVLMFRFAEFRFPLDGFAQ